MKNKINIMFLVVFINCSIDMKSSNPKGLVSSSARVITPHPPREPMVSFQRSYIQPYVFLPNEEIGEEHSWQREENFSANSSYAGYVDQSEIDYKIDNIGQEINDLSERLDVLYFNRSDLRLGLNILSRLLYDQSVLIEDALTCFFEDQMSGEDFMEILNEVSLELDVITGSLNSLVANSDSEGDDF